MNSRITVIGIIAATALAGSAFAQGGQQGGARQGGFGGGQFGQGRGQGMVMTESMLIGRNDVKKELKVTDEEKTKLEAAQKEMTDKIMEQFRSGRNGQGGGNNGGQAGSRSGFDSEAIQKQMTEMQKEMNEKVKAILTPEQWKRLTQIRVQMAGSRIFTDAEFTKQLGLKANQKLDIDDLMTKQQQANQQIMMKMREEGADREALTKDLLENDKILRGSIEKLLTEDQKKILADMEGPKFTPDPNERMNFGGAGFGGRNGGGRGNGGTGGATTGGGGAAGTRSTGGGF